MVLAAMEQHEATPRRLVDDDLAASFLPGPLRPVVRATRPSLLRRLVIGASERSGPGLWANIACRKRFVDDKLGESLGDIDAVVILGAGLDTRGYANHRRAGISALAQRCPGIRGRSASERGAEESGRATRARHATGVGSVGANGL